MNDGARKHRITLDSRVSGANSRTLTHEWFVLPCIGDILRDCLRLLRHRIVGSRMLYVVLDIQYAFFKLPLHYREHTD